jgi:hypothetical protein
VTTVHEPDVATPVTETKPIPWARWPWQRCPAVLDDGQDIARCDLRRGHRPSQPHRAERGMYDLVWTEQIRMTEGGKP